MRQAQTCRVVEQTGWLEYRCRISGASVEADCRSLSGDPCLPIKALMVHRGQIRIEDVPPRERDAVLAVVARLRGEEFVPTFVGRRQRKESRRGWKWTAAQRARMSEMKRGYWAERKRGLA